MSDKHKRGLKKGEFCTAPGSPKCDCGNNYRAVCKKTANKAWATYHTTEKRKGKKIRVTNPFEAHHLLCVSSVMKELQTKHGIKQIIQNTKWCINKGNNMIAMSLWGHTIKWYCDPVDGESKAPPFADIPQHDFDHNKKDGGYVAEVAVAIKEIAKDVKIQGHAVDVDDIAAALRSESKNFRNKLNDRGTRLGGTHKGWKLGGKTKISTWYLPFSMAATASVKQFPARDFNQEKAAWIKRLAKAAWGR